MSKLKLTDQTIPDRHQRLKVMKNDTKLKPFSSTDDEAEDINTMSNGRVTQSQKQHGNLLPISKKEEKRF